MRLTIDATPTLIRSAGVKNYLYYWITYLRRGLSGGDQLRCYPFLNDLGRLDHQSSGRSLLGTVPRLVAMHAVNRLGPWALDRALLDADIFHASNQTRIVPKRARLTATVHDLTTLLMPEVHLPSNIDADRDFAARVLRRADGLIAVSENTRQDAIRLLSIAPDRITTIHSGVPDTFFDALPTRRERPYVLFVGTIEPRKNLETLLDAWKKIRHDEHELLIAGPVGWAAQATVARIRAEATYLGYVPETELPGLVAGAKAFVYPSLYEGFGFPVVQAMAAGAPVITSGASCLPEIAGDAALLVDPRSVSELAGTLERLLESEGLRSELSARGRKRAQMYRWERCASRSLEFFQNVLGQTSKAAANG